MSKKRASKIPEKCSGCKAKLFAAYAESNSKGVRHYYRTTGDLVAVDWFGEALCRRCIEK